MRIKNNIISWTPTADQLGTNSVTVKVTDSQGGSTTQSFSIKATSIAANHAPVITSAPRFVTNLEKEYQYNLTGNDSDGDLLLWSLDSAPDGMVIDVTTGALRWKPLALDVGEHTVAVRLTDNYGLFITQEYSLKVTGTNTPPAIISNPNTRAALGLAYTYQAVACDRDQDNLTFSLGVRPTGMTIDKDTGIVQWTPSSSQIGTHKVDVLVRDAQGATSTQTYSLQVGATAINHAPSITSTPSAIAAVGLNYTYSVGATDPDAGDVLTYQLLQAPTGMTIDSATGLDY